MTRLSHILTFGILLSIATPLLAQQLVSSELKSTVSQAQMTLQYGPLVQNGVRLYKITYTTPDVFGQQDTASGLLIVPIRPGFTLPLLTCHRGTINGPTDAPSLLAGGYQLGMIFGSVGYVTAMPDLLGIGTSRGFHPYVHRSSAASASIDMLRAVKQFAQQNGIALNEQLFITGYSQGGYSAMAMHKTIQESFSNEFTVTASAPLSGPYSISGVMRESILSNNVYQYPGYVPNTLLTYNMVYDIYDSTRQYLKEPYATLANNYFNRQLTLSQLNTQLIQQLTTDFGASIPRNMIQDSVVATIIAQPDHPFNVALADNDVYNWAPQAPTRLFYCLADDQVPFRNSVVADSVMRANGATNIQAVNVNSTANHGGCVQPALINTVFFFGQYQSITVTSTREPQVVLQDVRLSPNPASDLFYLEHAPVGAQLDIFDQSGQKLQSSRIVQSPHQENTENLPSGIYFLRLSSAEGRWNGKLVVSK